MVLVVFTVISTLRLVSEYSNSGLHLGKGGGQVIELTLGVCHRFLTSGLDRISTLFLRAAMTVLRFSLLRPFQIW